MGARLSKKKAALIDDNDEVNSETGWYSTHSKSSLHLFHSSQPASSDKINIEPTEEERVPEDEEVYTAENDPIMAAAEKLSAKYDQERAALYYQSSSNPCIYTQSCEQKMWMKSDDQISNRKSILLNTIRNFRYKKRKAITSQDVIFDLYLSPSSERERKKERDRQQRLHYLLKRVWKSLYQVELKDPNLIIHWCCGIGLWDMEMAALYPNAKIIGIDFEDAMLSNIHHSISNLEFRPAIIHDEVTGLETFDDNSVDYIMLRDVWLMNAPASRWGNLLNQALRILKPGGSIELTEHTLSLRSYGPNGDKLYDWYDRLYKEIKVDRQVAEKLGTYLDNVGFDSIEERSIVMPFGEWGPTQGLREMGYLLRDIEEKRIRGLAKWVAQVCNVDLEMLNQILTTAITEEADQYRTRVDWYSYTAKKPCK